jgi:hypothetical protein
MILYTIMPDELIYETPQEEYSKQSVVNYDGVSMVVEQVSNSQCRIVRLLTTDPQAYLNDVYRPGTTFELKPTLQ